MKQLILTAWTVTGLALCGAAPDEFPSCADARDEIQKTWRLLERDLRNWNRPRPNANAAVPNFQPPADQVVNVESLVSEKDRDPLDVLLRRTAALHADLAGQVDLAAEGASLADLRAKAAATAVDDDDARYALFSKAMRLRKRIAYRNPVVQAVKKLLFITREVQPPNEYTWGPHVCDQFFGFHASLKKAVRGSGLYVIDEPFAEDRTPVAKSILYEKPVETGAWKGRKLVCRNGWDDERSCCFLSPDVSWDGSEIVFSATQGEPRIREWADDTVFHVFKCRADGSGLAQLTTGNVNDLFPCWLPNGRVVFCSERRGGYGRCHRREVPTFTLHTMFPDGTDITCLSPHETNEFEPSVDNDGRLVYMRWDYLDRGFDQAHHAWTTYPDGRDPRELQGNSRVDERAGCHAEQSIRAVPGARKYVATACGHHTLIRGSLVLVDPSLRDDGAYGQVKRITPDQLFPESETQVGMMKNSGAYATAWPLSEKYYLCVYDGDANCQYGVCDALRRKYDLTLLDVFGNKIRIYSHPQISCFDPMPLQARPKPPVLPHRTLVGRPADADGKRPEVIPPEKLPKTAAIQLMDVYNSRYPFPAGVEVKALRVWQALPKPEPIVGKPRLGACDQTPGRQCLGTVPVEKDGSAAFLAPVGVPLFFQALDKDGCAVQTMRSDTYVAPGETLACVGCHESREARAKPTQGRTRLALQRAPSAIRPEVEGSKPYNYPRLVQPVLDAKCVSCHGEKRKAGVPDLRKGDLAKNPFGFHRSFCEFMDRGLVQYYSSNYFGKPWSTKHVQADAYVFPYSEPGKIGARGSKLYQMLKKGHHGVRLSEDDWRRLVLFMDASGAYLSHDHDVDAQLQGRVVEPVLE